MIGFLSGKLIDLDDQSALVMLDQQGVAYRILLPSYGVQHLSEQLQKIVSLHTLPFIESVSQGALMLPHLIGFQAKKDLQFYQLFVTIKGIGYRRALRSLVLPPEQIALALVNEDTKLLQTLPEIGKKTAQTMVIDLKEKAKQFLSTLSLPQDQQQELDINISIIAEAVEGLVALGEQRQYALQYVQQVTQNQAFEQSSQIMEAVFALKKQGS